MKPDDSEKHEKLGESSSPSHSRLPLDRKESSHRFSPNATHRLTPMFVLNVHGDSEMLTGSVPAFSDSRDTYHTPPLPCAVRGAPNRDAVMGADAPYPKAMMNPPPMNGAFGLVEGFPTHETQRFDLPYALKPLNENVPLPLPANAMRARIPDHSRVPFPPEIQFGYSSYKGGRDCHFRGYLAVPQPTAGIHTSEYPDFALPPSSRCNRNAFMHRACIREPQQPNNRQPSDFHFLPVQNGIGYPAEYPFPGKQRHAATNISDSLRENSEEAMMWENEVKMGRKQSAFNKFSSEKEANTYALGERRQADGKMHEVEEPCTRDRNIHSDAHVSTYNGAADRDMRMRKYKVGMQPMHEDILNISAVPTMLPDDMTWRRRREDGEHNVIRGLTENGMDEDEWMVGTRIESKPRDPCKSSHFADAAKPNERVNTRKGGSNDFDGDKRCDDRNSIPHPMAAMRRGILERSPSSSIHENKSSTRYGKRNMHAPNSNEEGVVAQQRLTFRLGPLEAPCSPEGFWYPPFPPGRPVVERFRTRDFPESLSTLRDVENTSNAGKGRHGWLEEELVDDRIQGTETHVKFKWNNEGVEPHEGSCTRGVSSLRHEQGHEIQSDSDGALHDNCVNNQQNQMATSPSLLGYMPDRGRRVTDEEDILPAVSSGSSVQSTHYEADCESSPEFVYFGNEGPIEGRNCIQLPIPRFVSDKRMQNHHTFERMKGLEYYHDIGSPVSRWHESNMARPNDTKEAAMYGTGAVNPLGYYICYKGDYKTVIPPSMRRGYNLNSLLTCTTPAMRRQYNEKDRGIDKACNFQLGAFWEALEDASVMGLDVPFINYDGVLGSLVCIPYISAIVIYDRVGSQEPVFSYIETAVPHKRKPLSELIQNLNKQNMEQNSFDWLSCGAADISNRSWLAIYWKTMQNDCTESKSPVFLVYYSFRLNCKGKRKIDQLEKFAVIPNKIDLALWIAGRHGCRESTRSYFNSERNKVSNFLRKQGITHSDFNYFNRVGASE